VAFTMRNSLNAVSAHDYLPFAIVEAEIIRATFWQKINRLLTDREHNGDNAIKHEIDLCFVVASTLGWESHRAHLVDLKRLTVLEIVDQTLRKSVDGPRTIGAGERANAREFGT